MGNHRSLYRLFTLVVLAALLSGPMPAGSATGLNRPTLGDPLPDSGLYRTHVTWDNPVMRARLEALGVVILEQTADGAVVLVDDAQLEDLARLQFEPRASDELGSLLRAQGPDRAWLVSSLQPLVEKGIALQEVVAVNSDATAIDAGRQALRAAMKATSVEQRSGLASSISPDEDGDGLTNTEEAWWCTDPLNPNSDGDAQGHSDGLEVDALLDFTLPRSVRWGYGPPFGPPNAWPNFNDRLGTHVDVCNDGDWDTVPDFAEAYVVGTRVGTGNSENTDGDKFDDGQEFFGITYCPGGSTTCGYGSYPRTQDYSFITSGMPSWVRPPGDSPFVAAYPVIDFLADPATIRVVTKEIHTVERTITEGEEISTGFAETTGSSTTVGTIDTNTHSTWQENSTTEGGIEPGQVVAQVKLPIEAPEGFTVTPPLHSRRASGNVTTVSEFQTQCGTPGNCASRASEGYWELDSQNGTELLRLEPSGELAIRVNEQTRLAGIRVLAAKLLASGEILFIDPNLALKRLSMDGSISPLLPSRSANGPLFVRHDQKMVAYLKPMDFASEATTPNSNGIAIYDLDRNVEQVLFAWPSVTVRLYGWSKDELIVEVPYWDPTTLAPADKMVLGVLPVDNRSESIQAFAVLPRLHPGTDYPWTSSDGKFMAYQSDEAVVVASLINPKYGVIQEANSPRIESGNLKLMRDQTTVWIGLSNELLTHDADAVGTVPLPLTKAPSRLPGLPTPKSDAAAILFRPVSSNVPVSAYYDLNRSCGNIEDWQGHTWTTECGSDDGGFHYGWSYDQHDGTDYAGTDSDRIFAVGVGTVDEVSIDCANTYPTLSWGTTVLLNHGALTDNASYSTRYAHLKCDRVYVSSGSTLPSLPAWIADMGNTGNSTGTHLHFGVYRNGNAVDPYDAGLISGGPPVGWENAPAICYGPPMKASDPAPSTLPATQKRTWFAEIIGRLQELWKGRITNDHRPATTEATSQMGLPGCSGGSCVDQVGHVSNNPVNFSDNRSSGQCTSVGGSPGGSSDFGTGGGGAGVAINNNGNGTWDRLRVWSETQTTGEGYSTSHSDLRSQTEYREVTRSQTNTLVSSEAWSTATTVDPTDAATLTFNYNLYNTGSDAAVQLTGIRINILIGDLPVITWNAPDSSDILPGEAEGPFGSDPIHLSVEQLAAIDNGAPIRVVLADYGYNDNLYDQDAWGRGVLFHVDDGIADGDETIDTYLITTGLLLGETYQDVLARYFPVDIFDAGPNDLRTGTLTNIRTPEFDANGEITGWNDHRVGEHGWWELAISLDGETAGVEHFKDMPAKARHDVYLRYVEDSDGDGYSDRAEIDGLSDPNNPDIHPRPLLAVAQHTEVSGSTATVQLALQNIGNFDASSVEVWAVAPDDSITLTDNLIGGGGRVKTGGHVVLGARTGNLNLTNWTTSTAKPYPAGQYTGLAAKTITLRADANGNIGSTTGLTISWSTDGTTWTPLAVGADYTPLAPLPLSDGLTVAFSTGYVALNETFTFQAALPIDTFSYTINSTPPTPPLIVVSYNDPAGNHKFVSDVEVTPIQADLTGYLGQMRYGFQIDVMANTPFLPGANTAFLVFNNPAEQTLSGANLFVEFATPDGTVAKEYALQNQTLLPGPNVLTLNWDTADFNPPFDPAADYHILVFAADHQGTIFENTVKKLAQVGHDRLPSAVLSDDSWDFGTAAHGMLLKRSFTLANTGQLDLLTYVSAPEGVSVSQTGSRSIVPSDMTTYNIVLNTADLSIGPYDGTITIRTSDPTNPTRTVQVTGTITAAPADTPIGAMQRPLDWPPTVSGTQGQWVEFTHTLGPDPQTLHPVKVYSQDYVTLKGVGKYATPFGEGTASHDIFGDGRDGDLLVGSGQTITINTARASVAASGTSAFPANSNGFAVGDTVLFHQTQSTDNPGRWEIAQIAAINSSTNWTLARALTYVYNSSSGRAQVVRIAQYGSVTVQGGGTLTGPAWDGSTGGVIAFRASETARVESNGSISMTGKGFAGGATSSNTTAKQGDSAHGPGTNTTLANITGGGGGAYGDGAAAGGGGGGGLGTAGTAGGPGSRVPGAGGTTGGSADLTTMILGGAGGGGGRRSGSTGTGGAGGNSGGVIYVGARALTFEGSAAVTSAGNPGSSKTGPDSSGGGGGGAGGSILLKVATAALGNSLVTAMGASGGAGGNNNNGGVGGVGRVRVEYCESLSGSTNPPASTQQINCYIAEQIESAPYTITRFNLPESGTHTYQAQYGRRFVFSSADEQTSTLRIPAAAFSDVALDALISEVGSGSVTFKLDIGNDGIWDWDTTQNVINTTTLTKSDLAAAFNGYWATHSAPTSGTVDIPVRVSLSKAGQVLLTNLQVTPTGSKLRAIRLPVRPQGYNSVTASFTISDGSGPLAVGVDVGDDGSVDWAYTGIPGYPASLTTGNLAAPINAYLTGQSGTVDVPVRFYLAPFTTLNLSDFSATPTGETDAQVTTGDLVFSTTSPMETDPVTVTATLHNLGTLDTGGLTAAFYATLPGWGDILIGSVFVFNVPASDSALASILWDTTGFTGTVPVRIVVDPYDRVDESNETNNEATANLTILTRPDLHTTAMTLSNPEPVTDEQVGVTLTLRNDGQTTAGSQIVALYEGTPGSGGVLIAEENIVPLAGGASTNVSFTWAPDGPGTHRLFARVDRDGQVNEFDESNNDTWQDLYVGFRGPIILDSGTAGDLPYTTERGYGFVDEGQPDLTLNCGTQPHQSLRQDPDGRVVYRFDHLLPGHFYHLDVTLAECDGAGRSENVLVDGNLMAGPENLSDNQPHRLSLRLDPALYVDHAIRVTIEAPGIDGAVVGVVNLYDIDYRYSDAGGANDPAYPAIPAGQPQRRYGWLDGTANVTWGTLPYQSVRVDQTDTIVRYQYDGLDPARQYELQLTFWQPSGTPRVHQVRIDDSDTVLNISTGDYQVHRATVAVPAGTFSSDGSIVVNIIRTGSATTGAFVNEIALEEVTMVITEPPPTPTWTPTSTSTPTWTPTGTITPTPTPTSTPTPTPTTPASTTLLGVVVPTAPALVNQPVTVTLNITNVTNLGSFQFTLNYDPALVTVDAITLGPFPGSTGRTFLPTGPNINNTTGVATYGAFSLGATPPGPNDNGVLAQVRLLPHAAGNALLHLTGVQVSNVPGNAIPVTPQDGTVHIIACLGDFDGDGDVDIVDVQRVAYRWNNHCGDPLYDPLYDTDNDCDIDILDVQRVSYRWGTICTADAVAPAWTATPPPPATLSLVIPNAALTPGDIYTASLTIQNAVDLGAFEVNLVYDPTAIELLATVLGPFPSRTGRTFLATEPATSRESGTLSIGAFSLGTAPPGSSGSGALALLRFRALTKGSSVIRLANAQVANVAGVSLPIITRETVPFGNPAEE